MNTPTPQSPNEMSINLAKIQERLVDGNGASVDDTTWLIDRHHELIGQVAQLQMAHGDSLRSLARSGELTAVIATDSDLAREVRTAMAAI